MILLFILRVLAIMRLLLGVVAYVVVGVSFSFTSSVDATLESVWTVYGWLLTVMMFVGLKEWVLYFLSMGLFAFLFVFIGLILTPEVPSTSAIFRIYGKTG